MDRSSLFAIVVCMLIYLGYESYLNQKYPSRLKRPVATQTATANSEMAVSEAPELDAAPKSDDSASTAALLSKEELTVSTPSREVIFDQHTGAFSSMILNAYQSDDRSKPYEMYEKPLRLFLSATSEDVFVPGAGFSFQTERGDRTVRFTRQSGPWKMTHLIELDQDGYGANFSFQWENTSDAPLDLTAYINLGSEVSFPQAPSRFLPGAQLPKPTIVVAESESTWHDIKDFCEVDPAKPIYSEGYRDLNVFGVDAHYFVSVLLPETTKATYSLRKIKNSPGQSCDVILRTGLNLGQIKAHESITLKSKGWFGPKSSSLMKAYDEKLSKTIDLGFFGKIAMVLFSALEILHNLVFNWGVTIILFTLFLKVLFYPLAYSAAESMAKMKKIQPEINKVRERYKDDPQTQQQELMKLWAQHKVNPMKGCLPLLPQIPVMFAFYRVLSTTVELRNAPFYGWLVDLSSHDPYFVTPVILGGLALVQQKMMPSAGLDKTQEKIMMMMPLIFAVMSLTMPAGLVLYFITNTATSIVQQQWLNRKFAS